MSTISKALLSLCLFSQFQVHSAVITGSTLDFEPRQRTGGTITPEGPFDPGPSVSATTLRTGFQTNFEIDSAFAFLLPALAPGESIASADFTLTLIPDSAASAVQPGFNADLVGLGYRSDNPTVFTATDSQNYFYLGEGGLDTAPGRVLLKDNFLVPSNFIPNGGAAAAISSDDATDNALSTYLNSLYADPNFVAGSSYVLFRLNPDVTSGAGTVRYTVASAENATESFRPTLNLTVVPEPSTLALFVAGLSFVCLRFCRRR